jgi:hypothetical protein
MAANAMTLHSTMPHPQKAGYVQPQQQQQAGPAGSNPACRLQLLLLAAGHWGQPTVLQRACSIKPGVALHLHSAAVPQAPELAVCAHCMHAPFANGVLLAPSYDCVQYLKLSACTGSCQASCCRYWQPSRGHSAVLDAQGAPRCRQLQI